MIHLSQLGGILQAHDVQRNEGWIDRAFLSLIGLRVAPISHCVESMMEVAACTLVVPVRVNMVSA